MQCLVETTLDASRWCEVKFGTDVNWGSVWGSRSFTPARTTCGCEPHSGAAACDRYADEREGKRVLLTDSAAGVTPRAIS